MRQSQLFCNRIVTTRSLIQPHLVKRPVMSSRERLGEVKTANLCRLIPQTFLTMIVFSPGLWPIVLAASCAGKHAQDCLTSAETDEALESGGLASLGRHSDAGMTPRDPAWKHALRSLILYIASLITLLVLDAIWMKGIAPALGVDYFAVVKASAALASSTPSCH